MMEPSIERVRIEPIRRVLPRDFRLVSSSDGSTELHIQGPWLLVWALFFLLLEFVVVFGVLRQAPPLTVTAWVFVATFAFLALLRFGDEGAVLTAVWRFGPGRISRDARLPMPAWLFPREFQDVEEFEIVHALWTKGILKRRLHGGHQDTLRFRARGSRKPVTVMVRALSESYATLRGASFTLDPASSVERDILPEVTTVAALASETVGVPVYVVEKTTYVGSDADG